MERCDVLVVGGGPAGAVCAGRLRAAGLDVAIMDKQSFPRDKVCAGWITPAVVEAAELDLDSYRNGGRTLEPIHGFYTGMIEGAGVRTDYGETVSYGIRRCEFDHFLLEQSGARRLESTPLRRLERVDENWVVNDQIAARLVVGAGGHFCPVARHLGAKVGDITGAVAAKEVEFELSAAQQAACGVVPGVPELYFCRDLKGYGWCLIKGRVLNIGLGREDRHHLSEHLARFVQFLKRHGRIPRVPERFHGHAYLLYGQHQPRQVVADGALLIGDAAGLAYPQSGEGIRPAVESAILAAEAILDAGGDYRRDDLAGYERALEQRFGRRTGPGSGGGWLPAPLQTFVAERLLASSWFSRRFVLDRWFLHRHQPAIERGGFRWAEAG